MPPKPQNSVFSLSSLTFWQAGDTLTLTLSQRERGLAPHLLRVTVQADSTTSTMATRPESTAAWASSSAPFSREGSSTRSP